MKMKRKRRTIVISLRTIIFLFVIVGIFVFLSILYTSSMPKLKQAEKIENMTFEKKENLFFTHEIIRYYSKVEVTRFEANTTNRGLGVNVDQNYIGFGNIYQSSSSKKTIQLNNTKTNAYKIRFFAFGNISELIQFEKNDFLIKPGEGIGASVDVMTNMGTGVGNYTGEIDVVISIPKNWISKIFQRWI